ncbi:MAG: PVC-type heme-binding CxxCH protein, partial [Planctomycetota bacterium]
MRDEAAEIERLQTKLNGKDFWHGNAEALRELRYSSRGERTRDPTILPVYLLELYLATRVRFPSDDSTQNHAGLLGPASLVRLDYEMPLLRLLLAATLCCSVVADVSAKEPIRALIVDGRNNHAWGSTTNALRQMLLQTGRFTVDVSTAPEAYPKPRPRRPPNPTEEESRVYEGAMAEYQAAAKAYETSLAGEWEKWRPKFADYDVVVDNYNGPEWLLPVKADLVEFISNGGGMVVIHGANNAFSNWDDFNRMIGIGWRKIHQGVALTVDDATGMTIAEPVGEGINSGHGSKHPFVVKIRATDHPIMRGLPAEWLHGRDELYHSMRGPAEGVHILATAFSDPDQRGTGKHEPVLWATDFGRGRVVTNSMGHVWPSAGGPDGRHSLHCVGFQTLVVRSCEWAAGQPVTLDVPDSFPGEARLSIVHPEDIHWTASGTTQPLAPQAVSDAAERAMLKKQRNPYALLTPEESMVSLQIPDGYDIELVVSEPHIREPVLAVWDGNGRLYVAEMRSYMQDEYGTGTKTLRNGRISRHEDTNGDGQLDRHTVFVDGLNLPRMMLPLDDRLAVVETDTTNVVSYRDSDGDGVADEKVLLYEGSRKIDSSRSVEHQDSGLFWSIDNWIYLSRGRERFRFTNGDWEVDPIEFDWNQWSLDHDDTGRLFFNNNSEPLKSFQQHPIYWKHISSKAKGRWRQPNIGHNYDPGFLTMHSICKYGDRGEGHAYRSFTSATGGCVFRGDALGEDANGDYFICDPTGHIVRRANLEREDGKIVVSNVYEDERREFIASADINFRPVSVTTGPDGALYLVDMYRGMIQDAPWVNDSAKSFMRRSGLNFNIHHGRIYRITKRGSEIREDFRQEGADRNSTRVSLQSPKLIVTPTNELPPYLAHANGWIRDTTQKLIVLREDRDTVREELAEMASSHALPLARLHALWTLEGCDAISDELLTTALNDEDWRVREAAVRISEPFLKDDNATIWKQIERLASDSDPNVARQVILSLGWFDTPQANDLIDAVIKRHLTNEVVYLSAMTSLYNRRTPMIERILDGSAFRTIRDSSVRVNTQRRWTLGIANWKEQSAPVRPLDSEAVSLIEDGYQIYAQLCINCHGSDGKGAQLPGQPAKAPPLAGSPRVLGQKEVLARIVLQGLTGPVDNHEYREVMAPSDKHDDKWIASVLSYIRQDWGNLASVIRPDEVAEIRSASRGRYRAWTMKELAGYSLPKIDDRSQWKADSSSGTASAARAINGKSDSCDNANQPGKWF